MAQKSIFRVIFLNIFHDRARLAKVMPYVAHLSHEDKMMALRDRISYSRASADLLILLPH
jgi:hypothetical protein